MLWTAMSISPAQQRVLDRLREHALPADLGQRLRVAVALRHDLLHVDARSPGCAARSASTTSAVCASASREPRVPDECAIQGADRVHSGRRRGCLRSGFAALVNIDAVQPEQRARGRRVPLAVGRILQHARSASCSSFFTSADVIASMRARSASDSDIFDSVRSSSARRSGVRARRSAATVGTTASDRSQSPNFATSSSTIASAAASSPLPQFHVALRDRLQLVDVVQVHVRQRRARPDRCRAAPRCRSAAAAASAAIAMTPPRPSPRRSRWSCAAVDEITMSASAIASLALLERHRLRVQRCREIGRALRRPARHEHPRDAAPARLPAVSWPASPAPITSTVFSDRSPSVSRASVHRRSS